MKDLTLDQKREILKMMRAHFEEFEDAGLCFYDKTTTGWRRIEFFSPRFNAGHYLLAQEKLRIGVDWAEELNHWEAWGGPEPCVFGDGETPREAVTACLRAMVEGKA